MGETACLHSVQDALVLCAANIHKNSFIFVSETCTDKGERGWHDDPTARICKAAHDLIRRAYAIVQLLFCRMVLSSLSVGTTHVHALLAYW